MPRRLLAINLALLAACGLLVTLMVRTARMPWPPVRLPAARPAATGSAVKPPAAEPPANAGAYETIAARNLFSPTRSEAPPAPVVPTVALPKPNLYGVVVREGASIAYLEDPVTKRVAGYREGDAIAGGTIHTIASDRVVLLRPEGNVDVRLHDPSRPRPAAPPAASAPAGSPTRPRGAPPATPGASAAPTAEAPPTPRRVLPPSLMRRLAPSAPSNAPR